MQSKIRAEVFVPVLPGDAAKERIEKFINSKSEGANIKYIVDKSVIGGVIIKIGDLFYDGSVKRLLEKIE